ncbi:hypothetical protein ACOMHN_002971 [Nucella lapillus]
MSSAGVASVSTVLVGTSVLLRMENGAAGMWKHSADISVVDGWLVLDCLVLGWLVLDCLVLGCLELRCLVLGCLVLCCLVLCCLVLCCLVSCCLVSTWC